MTRFPADYTGDYSCQIHRSVAIGIVEARGNVGEAESRIGRGIEILPSIGERVEVLAC